MGTSITHWTVPSRDFQPRLGVVARTLARALPALLHMMLLIFVLLLFIPYLLCIMFGESTAQLCTLRGEHASYETSTVEGALHALSLCHHARLVKTAAGSAETFFSLLIIGDFMGTRDDMHAQQAVLIFPWTDRVAQVGGICLHARVLIATNACSSDTRCQLPFHISNVQSLYLWGFPFFIKACFLGIIIGIIIDTFHG